jgi:SAM-dependent methyltransferase
MANASVASPQARTYDPLARFLPPGGLEMTAWHDDDELWAALEETLFNPERLQMAPGDVDGVVRLLGLQPGARILDLCCGPGRHAVELAGRGYAVTGVDRNPAYLDRAREAAGEAGVELELVRADMREFVRPGAFDAVINLYTSFGYFEDDDQDLRVLQNVKTSLAAGGAALLDLQGKESMALSFEERRWSEVGGVHLLQHTRAIDDWTRVESRWVLVRDGEQKEFVIRLRMYSASELKRLFRCAGFGQVAVFGSLDGVPYDHRARRLVAVARRS